MSGATERFRNEVFDSEISFSIFRNLRAPINSLSSAATFDRALYDQSSSSASTESAQSSLVSHRICARLIRVESIQARQEA